MQVPRATTLASENPRDIPGGGATVGAATGNPQVWDTGHGAPRHSCFENLDGASGVRRDSC
jgi:hypothetical protein